MVDWMILGTLLLCRAVVKLGSKGHANWDLSRRGQCYPRVQPGGAV